MPLVKPVWTAPMMLLLKIRHICNILSTHEGTYNYILTYSSWLLECTQQVLLLSLVSHSTTLNKMVKFRVCVFVTSAT
jgi:hypothetical protein